MTGTPDSPRSAGGDDGWIEWAGGECPVPAGTMIDLRYQDGRARRTTYPAHQAWTRAGSPTDIIAYRVVPA